MISRVVVAHLVALVGCGGRLDAVAEADATSDAFAEASADTGVVDTSPIEEAAVVDGAVACGCCGKPFAAKMESWGERVLTTATGNIVLAGNVVRPDASLGPLWLQQIGDGGLTVWRREYAGEEGMLEAFVETKSGFVLIRGEGSGNIGGHVVATDHEGNAIWKKTIAGDKRDFFVGGAVATKEGWLVVGGYDTTAPTKYHAWRGRFDADGNLLDDSSDDALPRWYALAASPNGDVVMCGATASAQICTLEGADGSIAWRRTMPIDWNLTHVALLDDGTLYVAGMKGDPSPPIDTYPSHVMVAKLDPAGAKVWEKSHGWSKPAEMHVSALVATNDDGFALHGYLGDVSVRPDAPPPGAIAWYWYALRGNSAGEQLWAKGFAVAGPQGGQGRSLAACKDGLVLVGSTYTPGETSWMVRTGPNGEAPITPPGSSIDL